MIDLEVCTFIAKLENINFRVNGDKLDNMDNLGFEGQPYYYDPLTDDALCFHLMVDYKIQLTQLNNGNYIANKQNVFVNITNLKKGTCSPNRAICLAIIEANKND